MNSGDRGIERQSWISEGKGASKTSGASQVRSLASRARAWAKEATQPGAPRALKKPANSRAKYSVSVHQPFNEGFQKGQMARVNGRSQRAASAGTPAGEV